MFIPVALWPQDASALYWRRGASSVQCASRWQLAAGEEGECVRSLFV